MKTERIYFKVIGMYCITCKLIVEKQLRWQRYKENWHRPYDR